MAGQSITFDFLTRGADTTADGFRKVGDNAALASRGAKVLADVISKLGDKEDRTAAESKILASALKQTGDAEDRVAAKAVLADAAIRRLDDSMQDSSKKADSLGKTLGGLKLNPGLLGPAIALLPALGTLSGVATAAAVGLSGAFVAGGAALASFGAVAKPVLTQAKTAADAVSTAQAAYNATLKAGVPTAQAQATLQAANASAQLTYSAALKGGAKPATALAALHLTLAKNQLAYNNATNAGVFAGKAYATEQAAIAKAYAGMSPAQIALSKQLGNMAQAWQNLKAAQTPVVAGALVPWLQSVTDLTKNLAPVIAAVSPVIQGLGTQFDALVNSSAFKGFRDFIAGTGSAAVSAGGSTIIDLVKSFMILLPQFDPLIRVAVGWIAALGPAVLKWSSSKKASDDIQSFIRFFVANGPVAGGLLKNLGGALKALAPGLTSGGALELKIISDFLGWVAKLPPAVAKPLAEVAGALVILSKMGVLTVGVKIVGAAVKWLTGGVISIGGGEVAAAAMRAAFATGGTAAAAEMRAALAGGGAASGAEGAAGGAAKGAAGGGVVAGLGAAAGVALAGAIAGAAIRALGDALSPAGSFAGKLNNMFQQLQISSLHSFTFGGLEGWLTSHLGLPVGKVENNLLSGAAIFGKNMGSTVTGSFSNIAGGAKTWWGSITGTVSGAWHTITGQSASGSRAVSAAFGAAGRAADALRTANLVPLLGESGRVSGGIQGLSRYVSPGLTGALNTGGAHVNAFRNNNLLPLRGELGRDSGGVQGLQGLINRMHGRTVNVGVHGSGTGGVNIVPTPSGLPSGNARFVTLAAGGRIPGFGGGDRHPALLESGEAVVDKGRTRMFAPVLKAMGVPGMAAGGLVGSTNPGGIPALADWAAGIAGAGAARIETTFAKAVVARAQKALNAMAAAAAAGSGPGIVSYARSFLGKIPYVWGGTSLSSAGADCSGFTQSVYGHFGIHAPRTSEAQGSWVKLTPTPETGGLAFYHSPPGGPDPGHVAIIANGNQVISQGGGWGPQMMGLHAMPLLWTGIPPGGFAQAGGGGSAGSGPAGAEAWMHAHLGDYGWGGGQWSPLLSLWNRESGWRWNATNPSSGAYGIPQSLPADKMASVGADWRTNPVTQMKWGAEYIRGVYGDPAVAWGHEVSAGWYDRGGWLKPGLNLALNTSGRPEQVIAAGGAGGGVHLHLTVNGPVGSQQQLEDWFVRTANKASRTGRLTQAVKTAAR